MTSAHSKTVFTAAAKALSLSDEVLASLDAIDVNTMSGLAFSCGYVPGNPDDSDLKSMFRDALGDDIDQKTKISLRRLFVQSYTVAITELKVTLNKVEGEAPKAVHHAEAKARLTMLREQYPSTTFRRDTEPAQALVDKAVDLYERNKVEYLPLDICASKTGDILGLKPKKKQYLGQRSDGSLTAITESDLVKIQITDMMSLSEALIRRGAALHMADVLEFAVHETWHQRLIKLLKAPPVDDRHQKLSLDQVANADRNLWLRLAEDLEDGVQRSADGQRPMDIVFRHAQYDETVMQCLQQHLVTPKRPTDEHGSNKHPLKYFKGLAKGGGKGAQQPWQAAASKGKGKGGKKGKVVRPSIRLPQELLGCHTFHTSGEKFCFDYNMKKGCSDKACTRGRHSCCGCMSDDHGYAVCPNH
jgi:hypothetical protein